jgi:hypothetical protein
MWSTISCSWYSKIPHFAWDSASLRLWDSRVWEWMKRIWPLTWFDFHDWAWCEETQIDNDVCFDTLETINWFEIWNPGSGKCGIALRYHDNTSTVFTEGGPRAWIINCIQGTAIRGILWLTHARLHNSSG